MAHVELDVNFPDSEQCAELERLMNDKNAGMYVLRLWCWALRAGLEDGVLRMSARRLEEVARYSGRGRQELRLTFALSTSGLIVDQSTQDKPAFYLSGWSRNERYFKKINQMKEYRAFKKAERERNEIGFKSAPEVARECPSPSPSPSPPPPPPKEEALSDSKQPDKQRIRDPQLVRIFISRFNDVVEGHGGSPALQTGLDTFKASDIIERARIAKVPWELILCEWWENTTRPTYVLEALQRASPMIIEKIAKRNRQNEKQNDGNRRESLVRDPVVDVEETTHRGIS